ncbi:hypothetical protein BCV70DRAFT_207118 [Testicularia cyperi]|uniref:Protein kinase domain-containing protein n=1 Tax=Testicularia cyperi TaxID=1882483 RepID=A0A317XMJ9_9BASI|nr:hypothetical protein BCV70DRAFT_207118 [Testicularia cyperi]
MALINFAGCPPMPPLSAKENVMVDCGNEWPYCIDEELGLYTVMTGHNTWRVLTLTSKTGHHQLCQTPFWLLLATIANVLEIIVFVNQPSNVVHANILYWNVCLFDVRNRLNDLLDPSTQPHQQPAVVSLIDFGKSWVDGKCGECPPDDP